MRRRRIGRRTSCPRSLGIERVLLCALGRDCARRRTHFLCFAKESKPRKASRSQGPSGPLRCSQRAESGANSLRSNKHPPDPPAAALLSPARTAWSPFGALLRSPRKFKARYFSGLISRVGLFLPIRSPPTLAPEAGLRVGAIWRACEYEPRPAAPPLVPRAVFPGAPTDHHRWFYESFSQEP